MSADMLNAIIAVTMGGLLLSAITGNVLMYRQVGELKTSVEHLAGTLLQLTMQVREDNTRVHERIDTLARTNGG